MTSTRHPATRWSRGFAAPLGLALATGFGCRSSPSTIPQPSEESTPEETPGAAERESLGSFGLQPSQFPKAPRPAAAAHTESADGGSMEPPRTHWFRALRAELDDAGPMDSGEPAGNPDAR